MAINFPAAPTTNQTYTFNGRTWTWNGVGWQATGSTGLTVYTKTDFTATAGQTSFSCTYTVGFVDVYYNGSKLSTSEYTATTGSTVVLGTAAALGDIVETIAWTISSSFNPSLGSASATSLAIGGATIGTNALAVTGTTALSGLLTAAGGVSSTLTTDATSASTGSIITAGGISTQKALWVGTTSTFAGTVTGAAANFSGAQTNTVAGVPYQWTGNGATVYPSFTGGGAVQYNFSNGNAEVDFWNTANSPTKSFIWRQQTGASSNTTLLTLTPAGNLSCNSMSVTNGNFTTSSGAAIDCAVNLGGATTQISLYSGGVSGALAFNGAAFVVTTTSDERLKNWSGIEQTDYRAGIQKLWIGSYDLYQNKEKTGDSVRGFGVLAQQAYDALGGLAITKPTDENDIWQASSEPFAFLALWGVKDLYKIIDELTTRLAALESK